MIFPVHEYPQPLIGLTECGRAELVAVTDDHAEAHALAAVAQRPVVIEQPSSNSYGLWRVFTLLRPTERRAAL